MPTASRSSITTRARRTASRRNSVRARAVIGADGAMSAVARAVHAGRRPHAVCLRLSRDRPLAATGSRTSTASAATSITAARLSPDFYGWVFPHGDTASVGTGTARKGFSLRGSVGDLRAAAGLDEAETIRREGAPIPLQPLPRWDNGRDVVLAGDAAGVVAPASGEGIYYAMAGGRLVGRGGRCRSCDTGDAEAAAHRAQALHARAWQGVLDPRRDAVVLVLQRQAARALRQHLPRPATCSS